METIKRDLRLGFGLSLLLIIISSIASFLSIGYLLKNAELVDQSNAVIAKLEYIISAAKDAETAQRGYLLTNDTAFLQPNKNIDQKIFKAIKEARQLINAEIGIQPQQFDDLQNVLTVRLHRINELIFLKSKGRSINIEQLKAGKADMDTLRQSISNLEKQERLILRNSSSTQAFLTAFTPAIIVFAAILSVVIAVLYYLRIAQDFKEKQKLQFSLKEKEETAAKRLLIVQNVTNRIANGDYHTRIAGEEKETLGTVSGYLNKMAESLDESFINLENSEWIQNGESGLNNEMLGEKHLENLVKDILSFLANYTKSDVAAFYINNGDVLQLQAGYALSASAKTEIKFGEGIVGQCLENKKIIHQKNIDKNSIAISFATTEIKPTSIIALPVCYESKVVGVIELASTITFTSRTIQFLEHVAHNIGIALNTTQNHQKLELLLAQTQAQTTELSNRQHELESMNAELQAYTERLQHSEEELRMQQEELEQSNQILEERSNLLEVRNQMITDRNHEIQRKAEELAQSTQYKTEFMANMSHELRTPLNSILLLSRHLSDNNDGNLSDEEIESAQVILSSGNGLLTLIDEILDLSKIEAGKMEAEYELLTLSEIVAEMQAMFLPVAKEKNLDLLTTINPDLKDQIETDKLKLAQILRNLLSNALKFTAKGVVELEIKPDADPAYVQFCVKDSGIGISLKDQELIFEPFRQADGSTRRKYGGTGLGLSISKKLAELLNGEIKLISEPGKGSEFILTIPVVQSASSISSGEVQKTSSIPYPVKADELYAPVTRRIKHLSAVTPENILDDRNMIGSEDKVILIVEDDTVFANALLKFTRKKGYKGIVAVRGDLGIEMVNLYKPDAVLLDIQLPVKDGWEVMEELKNNPATRHIPVHIMSSLEVKKESLLKGAIDFISKPMAIDQMKQLFEKLEEAMLKSPKKVLIIEDNEQHAKALSYFLQTFNITSEISGSVDQCIDTLRKKEVDCVIMDMGISGKVIYDSLESITRQPDLDQIPIIVFTGKNLSVAEESRILRFADSIVVKTAQSYQRVLDEVALFLHVVEEKDHVAPVGSSQLNRVGALTEVLKGKTILIADDDVRNIFSLTKSFEKFKMNVITATNGREALEQLELQNIDIVLMDMMMPEMDGYESISKIRLHPKFGKLPVIAVTAKVMPADREACIQAGASDYISKPIDVDQLISLLRVWLYEQIV